MTVLTLERAVFAGGACLVIGISFAAFDSKHAAISVLLGLAMLGIAVSDAKNFIIPDVISLPSIPLGLAAVYFTHDRIDVGEAVFEHSVAAMGAFAIFWAISAGYFALRGRQGLGFGDVKLAAVAGAWTGISGATNAVLFACLLAISYIVGSGLVTKRPITKTSVLPFGVFFAPAIWATWCFAALNGLHLDYAVALLT